MGSARARGARLTAGPDNAEPRDVILLNYAKLGLGVGAFADGVAYLKHVFDNRFYDATFRGLWRMLERRGLTRRTLAIITSIPRPRGPQRAAISSDRAAGGSVGRTLRLASDPFERKDLSSSEPQRVREIASRLGSYWRCSPMLRSTEALEWRAEALETIRALGYVH
jgi:hypothetical protein